MRRYPTIGGLEANDGRNLTSTFPNTLLSKDLASYPFGKFGSGFVLFNMFLMAYGAMVAYLLIIKDTVPTVMGYPHGEYPIERNLILIITSLTVMVPLSMQRDMASLSFTSALSVTADVILVGFIAAFSPMKETVEANGGLGNILKEDGINPTLFVGLGILSTAMACQHSAFIVANSLKDKTRRRWGIVTNNSIGLSAVLCLILGVCGYLGFLGETQGDILNNFDHDSGVANAARILLAVSESNFVSAPFLGRESSVLLKPRHELCSREILNIDVSFHF